MAFDPKFAATKAEWDEIMETLSQEAEVDKIDTNDFPRMLELMCSGWHLLNNPAERKRLTEPRKVPKLQRQRAAAVKELARIDEEIAKETPPAGPRGRGARIG